MSTNILPSRGCVYSVESDKAEGFYSVKGLSHGSQSPSDRPILVRAISFEDKDITSPITTLGGVRVIYRFGKGIGNVRISGEILMGPAGDAGNAQSQSDVITFFESHRVSVRDEPVIATLPGGRGVQAYLYGLLMGDMDPATHTQPFLITGYLADID